MDPRENLYKDIKRAIEDGVPAVQHIDLWNENVAFADEESEWSRPAVFVEFGTISWDVVKNTDFGESIWKALQDIEPRAEYQVSYPYMTGTNHSHMELLENVDVFRVKYLKTW